MHVKQTNFKFHVIHWANTVYPVYSLSNSLSLLHSHRFWELCDGGGGGDGGGYIAYDRMHLEN